MKEEGTDSEQVAEVKSSSGKVLDDLCPVNASRGMANHLEAVEQSPISRLHCGVRLLNWWICKLHMRSCVSNKSGPIAHGSMALYAPLSVR